MFLNANLALKPLQIGEIISNNKIMQFSYCYWNTNEKKADNKTTVFHDGICHDCDITCASGKMHHGILFDRRLDSLTLLWTLDLVWTRTLDSDFTYLQCNL